MLGRWVMAVDMHVGGGRNEIDKAEICVLWRGCLGGRCMWRGEGMGMVVWFRGLVGWR